MEQAEAFFKGEGNAWLRRNTSKLPIENDLVLGAMDEMVGNFEGQHVLEIGCANGWRLKELQKRYKIVPYGIDPSDQAIAAAKKKGIEAERGFAHSINYAASTFDMVIYGFCLYLVDRSALFRSIAEGDRVLKDGGLMIVYDFSTPMPCKNKYEHKEGLWSYKQDYTAMFTASPTYHRLITKVHLDGQTQAVILKKQAEWGYPECE